MTVFSSEYHVGEDDRKNSRSYHISAVICAVALIVLGLTTAFVGRISANEMDTVPSFEKAIDEGRYADALSIYRGIQDEVLKTDPEDQALNESKNMLLDDMENIVRIRVDSICDHIISSRYVLTASDVNFLNSMSELTSSVVSERMYRISEDFLLGKVEKPVVMFFFEQLSPIGNFSATANPLLRELDYIETATGDVQTAETALGEGDYITAVKKYTQVDERYDGFVGDYCEKRVSSIKATMYEPMMEEGEHMLQTFKFYSAEKLFSDLAVIFPEDEMIKGNLLTATSHTSEVREYRGQIEVICVRSLIVDTDTAFAGRYHSSSTDLYLTTSEFEKILENLYERDYVLVNPENLIDSSDPTFLLERNLKVPKGKKPLVVVIENLLLDRVRGVGFRLLRVGEDLHIRLLHRESRVLFGDLLLGFDADGVGFLLRVGGRDRNIALRVRSGDLCVLADLFDVLDAHILDGAGGVLEVLDVEVDDLDAELLHIGHDVLGDLLRDALTVLHHFFQADRTDDLAHITFEDLRDHGDHLTLLHAEQRLRRPFEIIALGRDLDVGDAVDRDVDELGRRDRFAGLDVHLHHAQRQTVDPLEERNAPPRFTDKDPLSPETRDDVGDVRRRLQVPDDAEQHDDRDDDSDDDENHNKTLLKIIRWFVGLVCRSV